MKSSGFNFKKCSLSLNLNLFSNPKFQMREFNLTKKRKRRKVILILLEIISRL
jgi:hypothetical protein